MPRTPDCTAALAKAETWGGGECRSRLPPCPAELSSGVSRQCPRAPSWLPGVPSLEAREGARVRWSFAGTSSFQAGGWEGGGRGIAGSRGACSSHRHARSMPTLRGCHPPRHTSLTRVCCDSEDAKCGDMLLLGMVESMRGPEPARGPCASHNSVQTLWCPGGTGAGRHPHGAPLLDRNWACPAHTTRIASRGVRGPEEGSGWCGSPLMQLLRGLLT